MEIWGFRGKLGGSGGDFGVRGTFVRSPRDLGIRAGLRIFLGLSPRILGSPQAAERGRAGTGAAAPGAGARQAPGVAAGRGAAPSGRGAAAGPGGGTRGSVNPKNHPKKKIPKTFLGGEIAKFFPVGNSRAESSAPPGGALTNKAGPGRFWGAPKKNQPEFWGSPPNSHPPKFGDPPEPPQTSGCGPKISLRSLQSPQIFGDSPNFNEPPEILGFPPVPTGRECGRRSRGTKRSERRG